MAAYHRIARRSFLRDLGGGAIAVAILGTAACGDDDDDAAGPTSTSTPDGTTSSTTAGADGADDDESLVWEQVSFGFVSAYVLARGNAAAVVDTGTEGSADQIGAGLTAIGLTYDDVDHVVLTHRHPDHQGSLPEVMARAAAATAYAGTADVEAITGSDLVGVDDGADVFGLQVVATPGHTPGHISLFDPATRFLIAGDALNGNDDGSAVDGPAEQFSTDHQQALAQIDVLAALEPDAIAFGHGQPVHTGAAALLDALASG